ncbi:hypothetical protein PRIPAC_70204 [Pristionchus pacificus]|uniref:Uncharacterized protein n=1 Tax=Pristionchus pacificus TaxID=54126 RepID=A0A2A6C620_PRIPA|nr:hypothetical protein PRIPAC_70204 [Pristionchus pacificus]|eukprot:PDM73547.1 hypothetical protein PRIPAC_40903 [Pristionchus pacificus]
MSVLDAAVNVQSKDRKVVKTLEALPNTQEEQQIIDAINKYISDYRVENSDIIYEYSDQIIKKTEEFIRTHYEETPLWAATVTNIVNNATKNGIGNKVQMGSFIQSELNRMYTQNRFYIILFQFTKLCCHSGEPNTSNSATQDTLIITPPNQFTSILIYRSLQFFRATTRMRNNLSAYLHKRKEDLDLKHPQVPRNYTDTFHLKCSKKIDTKEGKTVGFFFEEEPVVTWTGDKPPGARSTGEAKYSVGEIDYKECPIMLDKPRTVIVAYP